MTFVTATVSAHGGSVAVRFAARIETGEQGGRPELELVIASMTPALAPVAAPDSGSPSRSAPRSRSAAS